GFASLAAPVSGADCAAARRLDALAAQLLDLAHLDAGTVPVRLERLRLRARVEQIVSVLAEQRELRIEVPPQLEAHADPVAFDRIVSHLLANALRYGAPPIRIGALERGGGVSLLVEDAGRGVAAEFAPLLFDRFTRSGESALHVPEGAGLGLAIG